MSKLFTQEFRNQAYAAIGALFVVGVTLGWIDQATSVQWLAVVSVVLTAISTIAVPVGLFAAWWKSRTATTTVIDVPKASVDLVVTSPGLPNVDANSVPVETGSI